MAAQTHLPVLREAPWPLPAQAAQTAEVAAGHQASRAYRLRVSVAPEEAEVSVPTADLDQRRDTREPPGLHSPVPMAAEVAVPTTAEAEAEDGQAVEAVGEITAVPAVEAAAGAAC